MRYRYIYKYKTGLTKVKTRLAIAITAGSFGIASLVIALGMPLAAKADSTVVITPTNTQGWAAQDGTPTYVTGPTGADGAGSLQLVTDNTSPSKENYFQTTNTPLSQVTGLGYMVDVTSGVPASYQLQVLGVHRLGSTSTFTSLVWEPVYNGQPNGPNNGFVSETNLENGTWWSSHPIDGDPLGNNGFVPLSQIIEANPDAQVVAYGANVGSGTPNATSFVDDIAFNGTINNFEPFAVATDKDSCKNGGWANLTDSNGKSFKNQGDCVSFVATGGKNLAAGPKQH